MLTGRALAGRYSSEEPTHWTVNPSPQHHRPHRNASSCAHAHSIMAPQPPLTRLNRGSQLLGCDPELHHFAAWSVHSRVAGLQPVGTWSGVALVDNIHHYRSSQRRYRAILPYPSLPTCWSGLFSFIGAAARRIWRCSFFACYFA